MRDAPGQVRESIAGLGGPGLLLVVVLVAARRDDGVDEDLRRAPDPRAVLLEADPLLEREQLVEPAALLRGRDIVGEPGRGRPGALAVRRGEHLVVADGLEQPERGLVLGVGLAAEPDDDVRRERDPRD